VEAGGHVRGTRPLAELLDDVRAAVAVPVVAAGGISTAEAVATALSAGADAARVGTAFLAATEADIHPDYLAALLAASADETVLTTAFAVEWPDAPHRVLRSALERAQQLDVEVIGTLDVAGERIPVPRLSAMVPTRGFEGDVAAAALYAGTGVGAVRRSRSAAEILDELVTLLQPARPARAVGP
jgi:nitronate monooxygenase